MTYVSAENKTMASKGPRSKLDHETRARRQKALEAPREPPRPKTHWDHVLEEMVWLSKDFESERKWKLALAKKVVTRASKSVLDHATWGEKKVKEEEQRLRKVAFNISKDVKKFWMKIEKLVLYKYQLELEERKKKALDKQLDFLLGQTERYSTMLAENLVDLPSSSKPVQVDSGVEQPCNSKRDGDKSCLTRSTTDPESQLGNVETDDNYGIQAEDELEDDEHTIEEHETQITEAERKGELAALQAEADLPIEELSKRYTRNKVSREVSRESRENLAELLTKKGQIKDSWNQVNGSNHAGKDSSNAVHLLADNEGHHCISRMIGNSYPSHGSSQQHHGDHNGDSSFVEGRLNIKKSHPKLYLEPLNQSDMDYSPFRSGGELDDRDYILVSDEEKDDEKTLSEEEELAKKEGIDPLDEIKLLLQESEMPIKELLSTYKKDDFTDDGTLESECASSSSDDQVNCAMHQDVQHGSQNLTVYDGLFQEYNSAGPRETDSAIKGLEVNHDKIMDGRESENIIADAAAAARSAQPTGNTFSTTKVRTKFPFLLKHPLREYQHIGLDWLVSMYEKRLNGILADEMGLGKTIMAIALLAHLACEKGIWGPHLIVVPTSVMLNWETEFLKWCPAFKILTYFGSAKERKNKRQGWLKPNSFHICITTYRLVIQDSKVFKRKKWKYLILDEAHLIKNWKSQRWQTLLNFNSKRRILLTGTPLQNDLMELWSLMHFLMPHIFQSHQEFKDWFSNPISGMVEGQEKVNKEVVDRLHNVLRPFILRRLKRDVEKQLPRKHEHVMYCRLSRRQRNLYEDFIASSETQATLAGANFFGLISVIMQLRKVCNHPDLFEGRPIISSFDMAGIDMQLSSSVCTILSSGPFSEVDLEGLNLVFTQHEFNMTSWEVDEVATIASSPNLTRGTGLEDFDRVSLCTSRCDQKRRVHGTNIFEEIQKVLWEERMKQRKEREASIAWWNSLQCQKKPLFGTNLRELVTIKHPVYDIHEQKNNPSCYKNFSSRMADIVLSPVERFQTMLDLVESFMFAIPASRAPPPVCWFSRGRSPVFLEPAYKEKCIEVFSPLLSPIRPAIARQQVYFPDRRLMQFDCGKLQELAILLRRLKSGGHRALVFTQMSKMLDILEAFINLYGYTYMRLDGSTQPEERQILMQRFNTNPKIFLFILSTRSGGVGINLVGADTVIFYDSDWNPAMDQQAQDRCHRIGQTREVHIYRLISESTIEENILKKANQKRALDDLVIQSGSYNTEFFKKLDPMELFSGHGALHIDNLQKRSSSAAEYSTNGMSVYLSNADVEAAIKHAEDEVDYMALEKVVQEEVVDNQEFSEEGTGRLDDDNLANEDDVKPDEKIAEVQNCWTSIANRDAESTLCGSNVNEDKAVTLAGEDEDMDMLADVKQMAAAAAAAGQASSSFENQLQPIDRYAMRFLDLWNPIIDKSAIEYQVNIQEEEWELDRIAKFKEDLEAEIDEDQEPFLYERWDADFATTVYRQHVEALTLRQLTEELEFEAQVKKDAGNDDCVAIRNRATVECKPKSKKKLKKTKFKSLKKGPLASESEIMHEEPLIDPMPIDGRVLSPEVLCPESPSHSPVMKKRKKVVAAPEEEKSLWKSLKKPKKAPESNPAAADYDSTLEKLVEIRDIKSGEGTKDLVLKPLNRIKTGGRISITYMPVKHIMVVKPERFKKKGHVWSRDCFPPPDSWSSLEDAMLCAIVHEFGAHWNLVSCTLYDMPGGGFYRGRFRHPVHCHERFRELFFKYIMSAVDAPNNEKNNPSGSGKALLKVTEDQVSALLNVISELPDDELLLQKHFIAILSSARRTKCRVGRGQGMPSSRNGFYSSRLASDSSAKNSRRLTEKVKLANLRQSSKLVMTAITDAYREHQEEAVVLPSQPEACSIIDQFNLILDFTNIQVDYDTAFPSSIAVSIHGPEPQQKDNEPLERFLLAESSCRIAENRFRLALGTCIEGEGFEGASPACPITDIIRYKSGPKSQHLGKHKFASDSTKPPKSKVQRTTEPHEDSGLSSKSLLPPPRQTPLLGSYTLPDLIVDSGSERYQFQDMDVILRETEDAIPHEYDPDFLADLDDPGSLPDIPEIS